MSSTGEPKIVAYHEAGHAVVGLLLGLRALHVQWAPFEVTKAIGETAVEAARPGESEPSPTQILNRLITCVAGMVAERRFRNFPTDVYELVGDYESACHLIATLYPDVDPQPLFDAALITAEALLDHATAWAAVEALAAALLSRQRLEETEILDVVRPTGLLKRGI